MRVCCYVQQHVACPPAPYLVQKSWLHCVVRLEKLVSLYQKSSILVIKMANCKVNVPNGCDFTIDNLPYGVFSKSGDAKTSIGVAIGDHVLDLSAVREFFNGPLLKDHKVSDAKFYGRWPIS